MSTIMIDDLRMFFSTAMNKPPKYCPACSKFRDLKVKLEMFDAKLFKRHLWVQWKCPECDSTIKRYWGVYETSAGYCSKHEGGLGKFICGSRRGNLFTLNFRCQQCGKEWTTKVEIKTVGTGLKGTARIVP